MTIKEAIQLNEQLEQNYRFRMHPLPSEEAKKICLQIATNYHQQAEWLKELKAVKDLIKQHDEDSMPEDFWYIDKIREVVQE